MPSPVPARRTALSAPHVRRLVDQWRAALARRAPAADLLPHLANGLLVELPGRTVRGVEQFLDHSEEFRSWYRERIGGADPLGGRPAEDVRVHLVSPVHAQVTITSADGPGITTGPGHEAVRQVWWVVLQDGVPRIRSITFVQPTPVGALSRV
jgi:hypothetical protein